MERHAEGVSGVLDDTDAVCSSDIGACTPHKGNRIQQAWLKAVEFTDGQRGGLFSSPIALRHNLTVWNTAEREKRWNLHLFLYHSRRLFNMRLNKNKQYVFPAGVSCLFLRNLCRLVKHGWQRVDLVKHKISPCFVTITFLDSSVCWGHEWKWKGVSNFIGSNCSNFLKNKPELQWANKHQNIVLFSHW